MRILVVAKAPVPGAAKTRLAATVGPEGAAALAAAALLDTLATATAASVAAPVLALAGDLDRAVRAAEIRRALRGWHVVPQHGTGLAARLARAHRDAAALGAGPVLQVGMDTPQATRDELDEVAHGLSGAPVSLGGAEDGGWWALALRDAATARHLEGVPMSTSRTGAATRRAFQAAGLPVASGPVLRDVDTAADAGPVAERCAPGSHFAAAWDRLCVGDPGRDAAQATREPLGEAAR